VGCGGGSRGADAGVEELHIVSRHEVHPQTVEQTGEQGVGPLVLGRLQLELMTVVRKETNRILSRACALRLWAVEEISL